jgi:hypothetical protein
VQRLDRDHLTWSYLERERERERNEVIIPKIVVVTLLVLPSKLVS